MISKSTGYGSLSADEASCRPKMTISSKAQRISCAGQAMSSESFRGEEDQLPSTRLEAAVAPDERPFAQATVINNSCPPKNSQDLYKLGKAGVTRRSQAEDMSSPHSRRGKTFPCVESPARQSAQSLNPHPDLKASAGLGSCRTPRGQMSVARDRQPNQTLPATCSHISSDLVPSNCRIGRAKHSHDSRQRYEAAKASLLSLLGRQEQICYAGQLTPFQAEVQLCPNAFALTVCRGPLSSNASSMHLLC